MIIGVSGNDFFCCVTLIVHQCVLPMDMDRKQIYLCTVSQ